MATTFAKGFADLEREVARESLPVTGAMPTWLSGALVRTGPAKFDLGHQTLNHWFDGLGMLHRFGFEQAESPTRTALSGLPITTSNGETAA